MDDLHNEAADVEAPSGRDGLSGGLVVFRDFVAICATAIGFGHLLALQANAIVAGAAVPMALGYAVIVAFPAAYVARAIGHHGVSKAMAWGAGVSAPPSLLALAGGPAGLLLLAVGALGGAIAWALVRILAIPNRLAPSRIKTVAGYVAALALGGLLVAYLAAYFQPGRIVRNLPALEVAIISAADRADLVAILQREAARDGELHVDDVTDRWRSLYEEADKDGRPMPVESRSTINVSVWRGKDDKDLVATVDDRGHLGRAWVMFVEYEDSAKSDGTQARMVEALRRRWPDARNIPVMPNGSYPHAKDLVWTGGKYVVRPERVSSYAAD